MIALHAMTAADDMTADSATVQPDFTGLVAERWAAATARDRTFWIALAIAALLHGSFFLGLGRSLPRQIGEADGADDAISVSVVTEADLASRSTVPLKPEPPPGELAPAAPPAPPLKPSVTPAQPEAETKAEPEPEIPPFKTEPPKLAPAITADDVPELLSIPEAGPGPAPAKKEAASATAKSSAKPQPKQTAKLDLSPPPRAPGSLSGGGGRSAGFERPPGITRSGANDDFARGVIRALQQTMPQLRDTRGRVTVRIILNNNGNVVEVQVIRSSNRSDLDQGVMFAAKQTSYPFPPPNSNDADRTFLVTYIYE
jgi:periplasmic protein TonB